MGTRLWRFRDHDHDDEDDDDEWTTFTADSWIDFLFLLSFYRYDAHAISTHDAHDEMM